MDNYIVIIIMKNIDMRIPPLSQLFKQKQDYNAHKQKLLSIMSNRKNNLLQDNYKLALMDNVRKNLQKYGRKNNAKSQEVAHQNQQHSKKIQNIKPWVSFKSQKKAGFQSRISRSMSSKKSVIEQQEKQNSRIKSKVKSMSSSLNNKSLMKDYRKSVEIRNRLMHFKTQPNQKIVLKMNRYLECKNNKGQLFSAKLLKQETQLLPRINNDNHSTQQIIDNKLGNISKNIVSHYVKEDIMKNKVNLNNKLFKLARQRRLKALTVLEKKSASTLTPSSNSIHPKGIFATEPQKKRK